MASQSTVSPQQNKVATDTMRAVRFHQYGGPEVLQYEDAPRPKPGNGELSQSGHTRGKIVLRVI